MYTIWGRLGPITGLRSQEILIAPLLLDYRHSAFRTLLFPVGPSFGQITHGTIISSNPSILPDDASDSTYE